MTLSACNTAFAGSAGDDGREVDSFGAIAQQLGAKGVIASLWSVSDEASARLMQTMYSLRQENPKIGKSEALRQEQERMVSGALRRESDRATDRGVKIAAPAGAAHDWTHPYYWAPFILIGNWQ